MKVTSNHSNELNTNKKVENQPAGNEFDSAALDGVLPGASEKSDFAGVLDRVTRSHQESQTRHSERGSDDHAGTRESKTRDKDKVESDGYTPGSERVVTREPVAITEATTDTRPVLHSVDLESIVTACRVQLATNGQQEVTLALSRSMLDGLQVRVSSDAAGRITADFLAANEGIKSLLDGRSAELIEQLRARGINLAEFKSSVAADSGDRNESRDGEQPTSRSEPIAGRTESVATVSDSESLNTTEDSLAAGATYRA
jgi:Flagellar hook-length control protein FliK